MHTQMGQPIVFLFLCPSRARAGQTADGLGCNETLCAQVGASTWTDSCPSRSPWCPHRVCQLREVFPCLLHDVAQLENGAVEVRDLDRKSVV